jgi:hypothetical protein
MRPFENVSPDMQGGVLKSQKKKKKISLLSLWFVFPSQSRFHDPAMKKKNDRDKGGFSGVGCWLDGVLWGLWRVPRPGQLHQQHVIRSCH